MKTRVLMIYPKIPITYWSLEYSLSFINKKGLMPPLGLLTIASMMPENFDIKLIDMNINPLYNKDIDDADLVFISSMIVQKKSFNHVVKICRDFNTPVIAGGPYPTSSYQDIEGVDYFVLNEAEVTLPKFISDYEQGNAHHIYWDEYKPDITETPAPKYDLIDLNDYSCIALQYSRGCPFNCEFCDIIEMFGRKPRTKDADQFIHEIESVFNIGYQGPIFIVDDNFIGNKNKAKELLKKIIIWQKTHTFPFSFFTEASINLAEDDELLVLMKDAGFNMVFIGIETPDINSLILTDKKQNIRSDIQESVKKIQTYGIEVLGGFIIGFDTDPENIFDLQIKFIQQAGIPMAMMGLLDALPNTQLYRRLQKENRLITNSTGNNTHDLHLNFIPKMDLERVEEGYKRVISEIYTPKNYFSRCITLLKRIPQQKFISRPLRKNDLRAFFLSLLKQTFSSYGIHYLHYLMQALWYNHKNLNLTINLAIKGHHFFKMTNEIIMADEFSSMLKISIKSLQKQAAEIIENGNSMIAKKMEQHINLFKSRIKKRHQQLNQEIQNQINETFEKFEEYCEQILCQLKQTNFK